MKVAMPEIVGNDALKQRLCRDILSSSLSHAYILEGPDGSGRHSLALNSAAALACEAKNDANAPLPCGVCPACKKILQRKSPDVIFVGSDGKATLGVDAARFIKEDVYTVPNDLDDKIYIIEDADRMTPQAQNAILLTLEEPPSFVHFFLLCNNASTLLETIRSRAPILRTEPIDKAAIGEYICAHDRRAAQMKLSAKNEFEELLTSSCGGIGRALELLEPKVWKSVYERRSFIYDFTVAAVNSCGARQVLPLLQRFSTKRDILADELSLLYDAVRDLILLKKTDDAPLIFYCDRNETIDICDRTTLSFLFKLQSAIIEAIEENKRNANVRLLLLKMAISANLI
jgi:DNA polymerase-3 subunit delta'